ncbi:MAG: phage holin family protein [Burkholderiaceae bacterium]|nr:phage holin family protein [Burkholderiaceae bacterium]
MFDSVRSLLALLLDIGATRLELAATELEEERLRLVGQLISAVVTLMLLGMAVLMCTAFLVVLMWDSHRLLTVGGLALAYVVATWVSAVRWRARAASRPPFMAVTVAELQRDIAALRPSATLPEEPR